MRICRVVNHTCTTSIYSFSVRHLQFFLLHLHCRCIWRHLGLFRQAIRPHAARSGVPEIQTVFSGVVIKDYLSSWAFIIKVIGLAFSVANRLILGKEGPFVHLVSVLANLLATSFDEFRENHSVLMEFVTVETAAGVSVAFNAPIGGVLFAFEEAALYFPNRVLWRSFFASALAELTLTLMNPFFNGKAVMFEFTHALNW